MQQNTSPKLVLTSGEPAGIGPDLCLKLATQTQTADITVYADPELLLQRAAQLKLSLTLKSLPNTNLYQLGSLKLKAFSLKDVCIPGQLNPHNAEYVINLLTQAVADCQQGEYDALVTAPLHKAIINKAGITFTGHTEFIAQLTNTPKVVMLLATPGLRVALATTHIPLTKVSELITAEHLETVISIINHDFKTKFGIERPYINVCGLNPHAGEDGYLGTEEQQIINPLLNKLRARGMLLLGASPADSAFTAEALNGVDVVLAMYHDQGLPVLKHLGFGKAVNITLGLPIIRTSVDHGTALDLAASGRISTGSLNYAIQVASEMVQRHAEL
jgi:4-hydroxythreonine-4-phosphate dehydrogenase